MRWLFALAKGDLPTPAPSFALQTAAQITEQSRVGKLVCQRGGEGCSVSVAVTQHSTQCQAQNALVAHREYSSNLPLLTIIKSHLCGAFCFVGDRFAATSS